ncbi:N,N'-diacetylchitobiose-specific phosphotransferase enzyme IIA component [Sodalis glossinidius str. 'morsitans']|uniref:N,N'-diacetylchitobiose-specific phosphotransferase enzyme IIA component n=1 Tax=Sodalis glossinidius (strain morsitans) TaxID=343509 RepID=Q2NRG6_SODGM|nr:PTS lactose/cellobiose transporter subunit IIA [Sodalis glossinidius]BAE75259.1 PTS system cellobiose-specific IIA component [Sodalis glossinidius str. 'morsitans']CRL46260.1 N,N'-diacetylchitobiose-specific phosphotransferase enzyme IIA component [Sodalis glossinidius str. 'morsitans']
MDSDFEQTVMTLLITAGEARSGTMSAIQAAREKLWDKAQAMLAAARQACGQAHTMQTRLIGLDEGSGKVPVTLIMVHAQDHLMTAMLCQDLAAELILLRLEMAGLTCA